MINIITAVSRPGNLKTIEESLIRVLTVDEWRWWLIGDGRRIAAADVEPMKALKNATVHYQEKAFIDEQGFACGLLRNIALDRIETGWIYCIDDDTIIHENLPNMLGEDLWLVAFQSIHKDGRIYCEPSTDGDMDMSSFAWRIEQFMGHRFNPYTYTSDCEMWRSLWPACDQAHRAISRMPAGYYNYLR